MQAQTLAMGCIAALVSLIMASPAQAQIGRTWPSEKKIVPDPTTGLRIVGQVPSGSPGRSDWHVAGSSDGRWAACDDFAYEVWVFDRHNSEATLLAGPQKTGADHIHPTFNGDNTKIEIESALISKDNQSLNICVVPMPKSLLNRTYSQKLEP